MIMFPGLLLSIIIIVVIIWFSLGRFYYYIGKKIDKIAEPFKKGEDKEDE